MAEKTSQTNSSSNNLPSVPAVAPTSDTPYIQPIIGKLGYDTKHPDIFGIGASPDNGVSFRVFASFDGLVFNDNDIDVIWDNGTSEKVKSEVNSATAEIPSAVSNASEAVKRADSAVANSKVNSDAIKAMQSAVSEAKSDADTAMQRATSAVSAISAQIAEVEKSVADTNSANKSAIDALKGNISDAQQTISDVSKNLSTVSANLDTYAKSAAEQGHDITSLKNQQGKLEADMASVSGNVAQLTATTDKLQANIKDNSGNIASLQETASQTAVSIQNAQSQVASVIATAGQLQSLITDQNKQITSIKQTASAASVSASDAKSNAVQAQLTASAATVVAGNAKAEALSASATASEAKITATNASSQAMQANATASGVAVDLKSVEGNVKANSDKVDSTAQQLSAVSQKVTTNEANISATQKQIEAKADQVTVDNLNKTVSSQAGEIQANANGLLLKADKTVTDALNKSVQEQQAQQNILANQITSKVSSADVEKMVDGKGFATKDLVESSITQASGKINESITNLQGNLQNITADLTGLQSTVKNKADQSQITQLANTYQVKLTGNLLASLGKKAQKYTVGNNTFFPFASIDVTKVTKGTVLTLSFDYSSDADCAFIPQLDGTPWIPWGDIKDNPISVKANVPGHYVKQITVGDDSWTKGTAKNIAIRIDNFGGTFTVSNLTLRSGDNVASTFDMLQYDMDLRVQKGDLLSQLNMEAGQTLIQSKKLFLDADSVVFSGKAFIPDAAIANLSLDKLTTGHITVPIADKYGNQIELGNDGINVSSALEPIDWSGSGTGYQDDKSRFNFNVSSHGMSFTNHIEYGKSTVKTHASDDYQFLNLTPDVLHYTNGSTDEVKAPSGMTMYVPVNATSTLGPESPGGFFAIGHEQIGDNGATSDKTIDIAYVAKQINGWKQGLHVNTTIYSKPAGASHNMRTAWVSWSGWDNGEHYPAIISDGKWWGGICFPSTGEVTLFDPYGHAMWPKEGNAQYSAWGDDYDSY